MVWFKIDDGFWSHPKVLELPPEAVGLWVRAGSWSAKYQTAGFISDKVLPVFQASEDAVAALVRARMWERNDDRNGHQFHEWRKHQDGDYRKNIPRRVRRAVMERDGYRCVFCGAADQLSLDHIIRYRDDGPDTAENLRVLCMPCNLERG